MSNTQLITVPDCIAARGIDHATFSALSNSLYPGAMPESIALLHDYCVARKLDPLKKPAHIVPMNVKDVKTGRYEWRDVIMPGVGELRITAQRTNAFAGQDEPVYGEDATHTLGGEKITAPAWCSVTVYRLIGGQRCAFTHREYFEEACGTTKDGKPNSMWSKRKRGQLAKCAEAGALRKAFPEESGGIITAEEVGDEEPTTRNITPIAKAEPVNPFPARIATTVAEAKAEAVAPVPAPVTTPASVPQQAPVPKSAPDPIVGLVKSVTCNGEQYLVVMSGKEKDAVLVADTMEIGQKAEQLEGLRATIEFRAEGPRGNKTLFITAISLFEEEGGELV
jgi:phage recombination protein Bet